MILNIPARYSLSLLVVFIFTVGCGTGDPLGRKAVSGNVNLDGQPVAEGNISFEPEGGGATVSSGANVIAGKYAIEREFGLPVGKYRVRIYVPKPGTGGKVDPNAMPGDPVAAPQEMAPPDWNINSKQTIEVTADGPHVYNFEIDSKKKRK